MSALKLPDCLKACCHDAVVVVVPATSTGTVVTAELDGVAESSPPAELP